MKLEDFRELETIQETNKLNKVYAIDEKGIGGANHIYAVDTSVSVQAVYFQNGARKNIESIHGVLDVDLLEIVRDRLTSFQSGEFACSYNEEALAHIESALKALNQRVLDRAERNVLGKEEK